VDSDRRDAPVRAPRSSPHAARASETAAFWSDGLIVARWPILVRDPFQDAMIDKSVKTVGEHHGGNAEFALDPGERRCP
jgi:hypothetical protein